MATSNPTPPSEFQPKINQKRNLRLLILILILAVIGAAILFWNRNRNDFGDVLAQNVNTSGMVAAIEYLKEGQKVVAFDAKGTKIEPNGYRSGSTERDLVWRPDGKRVFFVADREASKGFQIYRWVPAPNSDPELRSQGSLGKSNLSFPGGVSDPDQPLLITSGGFVNEFDPKDQKGHQILPPVIGVTEDQNESGEGQGGVTGQFSAIYGQIGDSFRTARWCGGKKAVAAVMRSDMGETLIVQSLERNSAGQLPAPSLVPGARGERVDFDIDPAKNLIVFSVTKVRLGERDKTPLEKRLRHMIAFYHLGDKGPILVAASAKDDDAFGAPVLSPNGDRILVTAGKYDSTSGSLQPAGLYLIPLQPLGGNGRTLIVQGAVYEPSWSPTGEEVAYAKRTPAGSRAIFISKVDGSEERNLSGDKGNFGTPKFSPLAK